MAEARVERRLAAILAADVAGYSRLMGADEEGTLAALKGHWKERFDPKIAQHRGRIVKTTGDGILAEFASAVDAVRCAIEIQNAMAKLNTAIPEIAALNSASVSMSAISSSTRVTSLAMVSISPLGWKHWLAPVQFAFPKMRTSKLKASFH
jgi:class 3 adenylate cyclase